MLNFAQLKMKTSTPKPTVKRTREIDSSGNDLKQCYQIKGARSPATSSENNLKQRVNWDCPAADLN